MEKLIGIGVVIVLIVLFVLMFTAESCEDRGMKTEFAGVILVPTFVNNVMIMQSIPQYRCVEATD